MKLKTPKNNALGIYIIGLLLVFIVVAGFVTAQNGGITIPLKFLVTADYQASDENNIGAYIASPTTYTDLHVDNDLVVDENFTSSGTTTVQEITYGSRFNTALTLTAGASTTVGGLVALQNTGDTKICHEVEVLFYTDSSANSGTFKFSVATSTDSDDYSNNANSLIATTTVATTSALLVDSNKTPSGTNFSNATSTSWLWNRGEYIVGQFDLTDFVKASSTHYTSRTGELYVDCHTY